jgi:D-tyrosyl-tRNA(Tyr) deacylase
VRAVVQRADGASVQVAGEQIGGFEGPGLVVLVGVTHDDTADTAKKLAAKVWGLRLFDREVIGADRIADGVEARELSASDVDLPLLVVSQFTLYGDTKKGRRPTWDAAAPGPVAEPLVDVVVAELRALGATVTTGKFGADMCVSLVNDGPFTVLLEV